MISGHTPGATPPTDPVYRETDAPITFSSGSVTAKRSALGELPLIQVTVDPKTNGDPDAPFSVGEAQGELLKELIGGVWEYYRSERFGSISDATLQAHGEHFAAVIEAFNPAYAAEIRGIAQGAGLDEWQLFALNARTELINRIRQNQAPTQPGECTSVSFGNGAAIIGQTWDWATDLAPLMAAVEITRADGHKVFYIGEPGIIGKMGMNSKGVGACLNILTGKASTDGVPIHVLLRAALDQDSTADALALFKSTKSRGTMSNILVADRSGNHALVEFSGEELHVVKTAEPLCHTNHYLNGDAPPVGDDTAIESTRTRFNRAQELLSSTGGQTVEDMRRILHDTDNAYKILSPPVDYPSYGMIIQTNLALICDLRDGKVFFSLPRDGHTTLTSYKVG